ncbi:MAG: hypothetical protein HQ492_08520, partial [Woeseiaceae bacterium]|nr:hypothetical protein [Woeseiaceae bacterium]
IAASIWLIFFVCAASASGLAVFFEVAAFVVFAGFSALVVIAILLRASVGIAGRPSPRRVPNDPPAGRISYLDGPGTSSRFRTESGMLRICKPYRRVAWFDRFSSVWGSGTELIIKAGL